MPDGLENILESTEAERLATGFEFTEGPLWHPEGYLLFVNNRRDLIYRLVPGGQPEIIREDSGSANGLTFDLDGRLVMCEGNARQMTRMEPNGTITVIADRWEGKRLHRPNDVVCRSDGSIYFTTPAGRLDPAEREIEFSGVHCLAQDGAVTAVVTDTESPNGLAFSPNESVLYVANTRRDNGCVEEKERGEVCTHQYIRAYDVAPELDNEHRPNDVVCRSDGSIYFTTPAGRLDPAEREIEFSGVHCLAQDGAVTAVVTDTESPNGLAFSPNESVLYVANTRRDNGCVEEKERGEVCTHQYIRAYDVAPDGTTSNSRIFANMHSGQDGVPDGMKVDTEGRVYCTGPEGVWVFEPDGSHVGIIRLPEIPANCCWGDADLRTMYFTARSSIYRLRMKTTGINPWRGS